MAVWFVVDFEWRNCFGAYHWDTYNNHGYGYDHEEAMDIMRQLRERDDVRAVNIREM